MNILVGCEESQTVCIEFRKLGFNAYSCDTQECSGNYPQYHLKMDIFEAIQLEKWDCMIAFPPCTHLAVSGAAHFPQKRADGRQQQAIDFFLKIACADIGHIAIENPVGIMSSVWKRPSQIIHPYYFGDEARKKTCLWLKNLPKLIHREKPDLFCSEITHASQGKIVNGYPAWLFNNDKKVRSKTFPGIARAMATQWGDFLISNHK